MTAPTLSDFTTNFGYTEDGGAVFIDSDVTLADAEGNWVGGSIVVSGLGATEDIVLVGEGNSAGQFYVAGNAVFLQTDIGGGIVIPMPIATITDAGTSFSIAFTANVSTAVVERVLEHLTYSNSSDAPAATERFTVTVTDGAGQVAVGTDFTERPDALDSLNGVNVGNSAFPALVDWDGDGDQDLVATGFSAGAWNFSYLRNNGDGTLTRLTGADNPFGSIPGFTPTPAFGDIDGDGDLDMVVGQSDGTFRTWFRGPGGSLTEGTGGPIRFRGSMSGISPRRRSATSTATGTSISSPAPPVETSRSSRTMAASASRRSPAPPIPSTGSTSALSPSRRWAMSTATGISTS